MVFWLSVLYLSICNRILCLRCNITIERSALVKLSALSAPSRLRADGDLLAPILRKRVSGTENNTLVREFIKGKFDALKWHVEIDSFEAATPLRVVPFHNIIATKNTRAPRKLVFAAHYDSKYFSPPDDNFVAATDSAVSCAILLDLAISLDALLDKQSDGRVSLQLIFFDGEEAFENWSKEDSIYGARHLAARWRREESLNRYGDYIHNPSSLKKNTHHFYVKLFELETKIFKHKLNPPALTHRQVQPLTYFSAEIEDDHLPFEDLDVRILHLIPAPFPQFWHTLGDDASVVSEKIVNHLTLLLRAFVAEYLCLEP